MRTTANLSERRVLDISGVAGGRVGVDEDQLTMVDVETSLVLLLFDVRVLSSHHVHDCLLQLFHIRRTGVGRKRERERERERGQTI